MRGEINTVVIPDPAVTGLRYRVEVDPDYDMKPADFDGIPLRRSPRGVLTSGVT